MKTTTTSLTAVTPESELVVPKGAVKATKAPSLRKRVLRILVLLAVLYTVMCGLIAWNTVRPKLSRLSASPSLYSLPFEKVAFKSADGTRLAGWFIPSIQPGGDPKGVVILCHGVDSTRTAMLWKASMLNKHGISTLLFDFRGRGESAASLCTIGYREVDDLLAAIAYVRSRPDCKSAPLGVQGESQGGAVALMGTARLPEVLGVVAESPFARLDHAVDNHFHKVFGAAAPMVSYPVRWMGQAFIRCRCCDVSAADEIARIGPRPLLLIQDGSDDLCPPEETRQLMAAATGPKELWTVPGAGHIDAEMVDRKGFEQRVAGFFDKLFQKTTKGAGR